MKLKIRNPDRDVENVSMVADSYLNFQFAYKIFFS